MNEWYYSDLFVFTKSESLIESTGWKIHREIQTNRCKTSEKKKWSKIWFYFDLFKIDLDEDDAKSIWLVL